MRRKWRRQLHIGNEPLIFARFVFRWYAQQKRWMHCDEQLSAGREVDEAANFIDPIESDTMHHPSSWIDERERLSPRSPVPARRVVSTRVLWAVLAFLLIEWWWYSRRASTVPR